MANKRITISLPFKVERGIEVLNQLGQSVGLVVETDDKPTEDTAGNYRWKVTADVEEKWVHEKLQCMEPTFPVA